MCLKAHCSVCFKGLIFKTMFVFTRFSHKAKKETLNKIMVNFIKCYFFFIEL